MGIPIVLAGNMGRAQQAPQVLSNQVPPGVGTGQAALVGAMPANQRLNLSIVLPLRNQQALTALLGRLYDPFSSDYRHFLTVAQFTKKFGPTTGDYQSVVEFAKANGFTVTHTFPNRLVVSVSGTVAQIDHAFNVKMNTYKHATGSGTFYSPDRAPSLDLSVPIDHITGLNNFSIPIPMLVQPSGAQANANVNGSGPGGSYLASDMRAAYYGGTTLDGNGQAVGLVEFGGYNLSDVDLTFSNAGQSYSVPINNVLLDNTTGNPGSSDSEEVLDIVQAIGMAPGLSQVRVYIGTNDADILSSMASENIAKQLGCSWGWRPDDPQTDDVFFQEFAAQGQSFFAASGDWGAFDASLYPYFYPQEDEYVTAVGGTHLTTKGAGGSWSSESAWNSDYYGSGGGISPDGLSIPSWQSGLANSNNGGSDTLRNVPDVAMEADFDNYVCAMGSCYQGFGGTSFAAPRWAGFMALVNQQAVEAGNAPSGGVGFINPAIYALAQTSNYGSDFHDITSGNNDTRGQPVYYNAVTGYDLVTGWGSASGQSLIDDLAGPQVPGFWILASSPTVSMEPGGTTSTTIKVSDAGGFTGDVTLAVTSTLPTGVTASWSKNPTSGTSVLTLTADNTAPGGTKTVTITGTSGGLTATTNITVAVHTPSFTLSASPNSLSLNQSSSASSTVTVTPQYGFTGNVNLTVSGLPSGVTSAWSINPTSGTSVLTLTASSSAAGGTYTLTVTGTSGSLTATTSIALAVHAPSFTLSSGSTLNIGLGGSGTDYVYVNPQYGFTGNVNLAVTGLPTGVTASFSPNPTTNNTAMTVTVSNTATVGTYTLTITGTSGSLTATANVTLGVHAPSFTLSGPGTVNIGQGTSSTANIYINGQYGFTGSVTFSISGLPSGVTALWNPNPANMNSGLTLTASDSAPTGQYTVTVTGVSGDLTATTTFTLGVYVPTFTLSGSYSVDIGQGTSGTAYVYVSPQYGFTGSVNLSVTGLPSGVTASFSPNPTSSNSNLTLTASGSAPVGQYTLTVTGKSGSQTATMTLTLGVYTPTFTISSSTTVNVGQGTSGTAYVHVYPQYGFTGSVNLSVSGLPSGVTASFSPNPTTGNSQLTFTATNSAAVGQYPLVITGTSGAQTATTTLTLGVYVPTFTLGSPGTLNIGQGSSGTSYVYVYPQYGFTGSVTLSASGLPSGVTATFSPNPTTGTSTLTLTASDTASLGQYTVTITGTSGAQTATTTLTLGIYVPTFSLWGPGTVNIGQGSTSTAYVNVNSQYGFSGNVSFSVSGLPSGVTASFSPNPATSNSTLTLTASASAPLGQYTVTITGTSGSQTASVTFVLAIYAQSFTLWAYPNSLTVNQGASGTATISVTPQYGFSGNITFSASGLPSGVTATFSPNPATGSSTLTLAASDSATAGTATLTITGTSGSLTASTTLNLTVNAQGFTLAVAPSEISLYPGSSGNSTILVVPENGFAGSVNLAVTGLPSGVTQIVSPNPASGSSTLTLTASNSVTPGTATLTVTGTSGSLVATTSIGLAVTASPASTSTTLALTSAGSPVTSVAQGAVVTLTAGVSEGSTPLTAGEVNFCDATAAYCNEPHRLGSAQLTSAGTAVLRLIPGMGSHSYKAVFVGTNAEATSSSGASNLTVTASAATITTIAQSGSAGNYTLTATVKGQGLLGPSGNVSFVDTSSGNSTLGSATLGQADAAWSQVNTQTPTAGTNPVSIAAGDFNGDGIPDLAVANYTSDNVTILLGNGDGTFTATASSLQTGNSPGSVVVGDFNGDGKADLAVTNGGDNNVTILLGNGDGTFTATAVSPQTGESPGAMVEGDFNGDGVQDLAVSNLSNHTITVLLGNGDGTFTASPFTPQVPYGPGSLVTGDFNGDGKVDLAATGGGSITVLLGNGDGTFAPGLNLTASSGFSSLAVGDFNGDGKADLAAVNYYGQTVTILLGNGDGTFTANSSTSQTGTNPASIAVGDLNGDGNQDLVVPNEYGSLVTILLGNGDGTFSSPGPLTARNAPESAVIGDLNGDGVPDLAVANYFNGSVSVFTSQLAQTATATASGISPVGSGTHNVEASYAGDTHYKSSVSATTALTVQAIKPTVTVTPSASSITTAQALTVAVAVSGGSGDPTPTGTITLTSGSYSSQQTLAAGKATFTLSAGMLPVGTDVLNASYTPDASSSSSYTSASQSASVTVSQAIGTAVPTVTATPSAATITDQQSVDVAVSVAGVSGQATPTGTVTLSSGSYSSQQTLSSGAASFTIAAGTLSSGANTLTITYSGDATYAAASTTTSVTVSEDAITVTSLSPSSVAPGASATGTVTLATSSNYSGTMDLSCTLTASPAGAQSLPTCSLSPGNLAFTSGGTGTSTLTVRTTASSSAALNDPRGLNILGVGCGGTVLAFVLMFDIPSRRRRWASFFVLLCVVAAVAVAGCGGGGGGSSSGGSSPPSTPSTTAGTYTFKLTGTDAANSKTTVSTTFSITVK